MRRRVSSLIFALSHPLPKTPFQLKTIRYCREEHFMDRYRCRPEHVERFGSHMNFRGNPYGPIPWCLAFRENLLHGPMALKVCQKFPRNWYWSMDGSSQHFESSRWGIIISTETITNENLGILPRFRCAMETSQWPPAVESSIAVEDTVETCGLRENLNGHRYMATGKWPENDQQKAPRSFSHFFAGFRLFPTLFALFRSFSHFLGSLFLTVFGRFRTFSHHSPADI